MAKLHITWKRSTIGCPQDQRRTIRALGLLRLNYVVAHEDTATIRGMVHKVRHLVKVEEVSDENSKLQRGLKNGTLS